MASNEKTPGYVPDLIAGHGIVRLKRWSSVWHVKLTSVNYIYSAISLPKKGLEIFD